ncbi:MAG: contractile injection system protein, VgrG/Pvc8 family [Rhodanobacter sp.]
MIEPIFKIIANDADITSKIRERFKSLRLVDETGTISDTVEISLADHDPEKRIKLPPTGAELEVFIGYDGALTRKGLFIVDEIELSGYPCEIVLRACAAPYETSKGGKIDLQTQKTRSWPKGTTLGAMVKRIAGEHRLKPAISPGLAAIALPHTDQSCESDMNLLSRLAKRYDAIAKPADGLLVFAKRGNAQSASGKERPGVTLTPMDGSDYRVVIASRDSAGTVVAYYRDTRKAQRREVTIGGGDPVVRLRMAYADRVSAENAARATQRNRARGERRLTYTLPGRPEIIAESIATMRGFRDGVDGEWLIKRAEHYIGPDGYRTSIACEQPNSSDDARAANSAEAVDSEQDATEIAP